MPGPAAGVPGTWEQAAAGPRRAETACLCWDKCSVFVSGALSALRSSAQSPGRQLSSLCSLSCASCPLLDLQRLCAVLPQGAHVTINARAEEDVEPECIMQKVARASGANYAFHKESGRFQDMGPQAPVVSAPWAQVWQAGASRWAGFSLMYLGSCLPGFWSLGPIPVPTVTPCQPEAGAAPGGAGASGHEEQPSVLPAGSTGWSGASHTPGTVQSQGHSTNMSCTVLGGGLHGGM